MLLRFKAGKSYHSYSRLPCSSTFHPNRKLDSSNKLARMSKTEILDELPKLTKAERFEIRLKLAELDGDGWLDDDDPLTDEQKDRKFESARNTRPRAKVRNGNVPG